MDIDIIRAWKDRSYRESLNPEEQALLPENPVGQIELTEEELKKVSGAMDQAGATWRWCPPHHSWRWCPGGHTWRHCWTWGSCRKHNNSWSYC